MISINSSNQFANSISNPTSSDNSSTKFSDLLSEQVAKAAETDKTKQPISSENEVTNSKSASVSDTKNELERLLAMSPMELIRYQMLGDMGLTEEALKELPFEEQLKIEEKIQEKIDQVMGSESDKSGALALK